MGDTITTNTGWKQEYRDCTITLSYDGKFQADVYGKKVVASSLDGLKTQIRNAARPPDLNMDLLYVDSDYKNDIKPVVLIRRNLNGTYSTDRGQERFARYGSKEYFARRDPEKEALFVEAKKKERAAHEAHLRAVEELQGVLETFARVTDVEIVQAELEAKAKLREKIDTAFHAPLTRT